MDAFIYGRSSNSHVMLGNTNMSGEFGGTDADGGCGLLMPSVFRSDAL